MNGRIKNWFWKGALLGLVVLLATSCERPLKLQVVLDRDEAVQEGATVYVDAVDAGEVTDVGEEGGERVAELTIRDKEARARLCVGAVRVKEPGKIQIKTDTVEEGARPLPHGARVPTTSKIEYLITKYSAKSTLVAVLIAVAVVVVLWLVFRSLVGTVGMILCVVLASILTHAVNPYLTPMVEHAMESLGPPPQVESSPSPSEPESTPPPDSGSTPSTSSIVKKFEHTVIEVINERPSPVVVSWCAVFLVLFIVLNLVLGKVSRVWRK